MANMAEGLAFVSKMMIMEVFFHSDRDISSHSVTDILMSEMLVQCTEYLSDQWQMLDDVRMMLWQLIKQHTLLYAVLCTAKEVIKFSNALFRHISQYYSVYFIFSSSRSWRNNHLYCFKGNMQK